MPDASTTWIVLPLVAALIGYATNRLAVRMIFRPIRPRGILGVRVQGLVPRRQPDLARSIGRVVGDHLVSADDLGEALRGVDLSRVVDAAFDRGLGPKLAELRQLPLVGGFLTDERIAELRARAVDGVVGNQDEIMGDVQESLRDGLDVGELVERKVAAFPVERLEELILEVAAKELRAIEWWGAGLGLAVGLVQAALLTLT